MHLTKARLSSCVLLLCISALFSSNFVDSVRVELNSESEAQLDLALLEVERLGASIELATAPAPAPALVPKAAKPATATTTTTTTATDSSSTVVKTSATVTTNGDSAGTVGKAAAPPVPVPSIPYPVKGSAKGEYSVWLKGNRLSLRNNSLIFTVDGSSNFRIGLFGVAVGTTPPRSSLGAFEIVVQQSGTACAVSFFRGAPSNSANVVEIPKTRSNHKSTTCLKAKSSIPMWISLSKSVLSIGLGATPTAASKFTLGSVDLQGQLSLLPVAARQVMQSSDGALVGLASVGTDVTFRF